MNEREYNKKEDSLLTQSVNAVKGDVIIKKNTVAVNNAMILALQSGFGDITDCSRLLSLGNILISLSDYFINNNAIYSEADHIVLKEIGVCNNSIKNSSDIIIKIFDYEIYTSFKDAKEKCICISRIYTREFESKCDITYNLMDEAKHFEVDLEYDEEYKYDIISSIFTKLCRKIVIYVQDQIRRYKDEHEERI